MWHGRYSLEFGTLELTQQAGWSILRPAITPQGTETMNRAEYHRYMHHYRRHDYRAAKAESMGHTAAALSYRRAQLDWSRMLPGNTRRVTLIDGDCTARYELARNFFEAIELN